jgi:Fe-S cluster assembly protein SufD
VATRTRVAKLNAPPINLADVEALSASKNEPLWLLESRLAAWELYADMPMPSLQAEEWRRTDYTSIRWEQAGLLTIPAGAGFEVIPAENRAPLIGSQRGGLIAAVDGRIVHNELGDGLRRQGVIFTDLDTAVREYADLVRPNLMTQAVLPGEGKFAALHAALWTHGVFLYVPRGRAVDLPLHSIFYNTRPGLTLGHILIVAEEGAQITYLQEYLSAADVAGHAAYVGATELLIGSGVNVKYVSLQDWGRNVYDFRHERARVGRDSQLDWIIGTMGSRLTKDFAEIELDGEEAGRGCPACFSPTRTSCSITTRSRITTRRARPAICCSKAR